MEIVIREFVEADREALRALFVASRRATFTWETEEQHRALDFDASTDQEKILVAVVGSRPVGFASIWEPDNFLHNLFVHPDFQRQGVGKALLRACARVFTNTPTLKCSQANIQAQQFYAAQGWTIIGEGDSSEGPHYLMAWEPANGEVTS